MNWRNTLRYSVLRALMAAGAEGGRRSFLLRLASRGLYVDFQPISPRGRHSLCIGGRCGRRWRQPAPFAFRISGSALSDPSDPPEDPPDFFTPNSELEFLFHSSFSVETGGFHRRCFGQRCFGHEKLLWSCRARLIFLLRSEE